MNAHRPPHRLVVFASGAGSGFHAITEASRNGTLKHASVVALVCNRPSAPVVGIAHALGVPTTCVDSAPFLKQNRRAEYDAELLKVTQQLRPDFICLAGYMLVLAPQFIREFPRQILNIHPSLLPKYRGLHAVRQALAAGEKEVGCTVHWVSEGVDEGEIIAQDKFLLTGEIKTEAEISERLKQREHALYVRVLSELCR